MRAQVAQYEQHYPKAIEANKQLAAENRRLMKQNKELMVQFRESKMAIREIEERSNDEKIQQRRMEQQNAFLQQEMREFKNRHESLERTFANSMKLEVTLLEGI